MNHDFYKIFLNICESEPKKVNLFELITEVHKIEKICQEILENEEFITIDVEFFHSSNKNLNSEKSFLSPETKWNLSLIQIASPKLKRVFIFDIDFYIERSNLTNLKNLLISDKVLKVFHDHRQDFWAIFSGLEVEINNIFDTQIADMFLNSCSSFRSYGNLVLDFLKIKLDKTCQNDDWSKRPLDVCQLNYAAFDVIYLVSIFEKIFLKLSGLGRVEWKKEYLESFFFQRKIERHRVFKLFSKFNICPKKSDFDFPSFLKLEKLIDLFENFEDIRFHYIKNIFESKKLSPKKLHNIFSDLKKEVLKSEKFKKFFDKILEIFDKKISDEGCSSDFELIFKEDIYEIQEKFKIFRGIFRKIQVLKVELDFEFSHVFLILKYILKKSSIEYKISPQLICEKHDIFEFIQSFQKNKSTDNFFMNFSESEQNKLYEDILISEYQKKSILETGFRSQVFGMKAKKFLNGDLKISFNKEIGEFQFS